MPSDYHDDTDPVLRLRDGFHFHGMIREGTHLALPHLHMSVGMLHIHYINRGDFHRTVGHFLGLVNELRGNNPVLDIAHQKCPAKIRNDALALYDKDPFYPLDCTLNGTQYHRLRPHGLAGIFAANNIVSRAIHILRHGKIGTAAQRETAAEFLIGCAYSPTPRMWNTQELTNLRQIAGLPGQSVPGQKLVFPAS
jgi:hypothetical protein